MTKRRALELLVKWNDGPLTGEEYDEINAARIAISPSVGLMIVSGFTLWDYKHDPLFNLKVRAAYAACLAGENA